MKRLLALCIAVAAVIGVATISPAQKSIPTAVGKWTGQSLCTVKPSPCHDETVVYEITVGKNETLNWKADKIVNGEQQNMGTLDCTYANSTMTCDMPGKGVWTLTVQGDAMTGTLKLSDGTLFRKVSVKRM